MQTKELLKHGRKYGFEDFFRISFMVCPLYANNLNWQRVCDEPTAAIDPYEETKIYNRFAGIGIPELLSQPGNPDCFDYVLLF